ncbi:MAG: hypothetical protein QXK18_05680 [Candidatus Bathyarchaeia archaeon]
MRNGLRFGVGDLEVLKSLKKILNRLSNYCLGLSIVFFVLALLLPVFWSRYLLGFSFLSGFWDVFVSLEVSGIFILVLITAIVFVSVFVFASFVKKRLLYG